MNTILSKAHKIACTVLFLFVAQVFVAQAVTDTQAVNGNDEITTFEYVMKIETIDVLVPTVVSVPLYGPKSQYEQRLVRELGSVNNIGSILYQTNQEKKAVSVKSDPSAPSLHYLVDGRIDTATQFLMPTEGKGEVTLKLSFGDSIVTSELQLQLDRYVALPRTVEVKYSPRRVIDKKNQLLEGSGLQTIVAKKEMTGTRVTFPEVTANYFEVTFTYAQPLRITEIDFREEVDPSAAQHFVRFLAQPEETYEIYFDADRPVIVSTSEAGNLRSDEEVLTVTPLSAVNNPRYIPADVDGDGVRDLFDNCVRVENVDQADINNNGRGDVCDDFDNDGVLNVDDNCVNYPNRNQSDVDLDGIGDECDEEESRLTEANPWIPWVGMGTAALVLLVLFALVAKGPRPQRMNEKGEVSEENEASSDKNDSAEK